MTGVLSHASGFSNQSSTIMLTEKKKLRSFKGECIRLYGFQRIKFTLIEQSLFIFPSYLCMECVYMRGIQPPIWVLTNFFFEGANDYSKCRQCVLTFSSFLLHAILAHFCRISWWAVDVFPRNTASEYSPFRILVSVCVCVFVYSLLPITTAATKLQCI